MEIECYVCIDEVKEFVERLNSLKDSLYFPTEVENKITDVEWKLKDLRDKGCISQNTYNAIASHIRGIKVGVKENFKLAEEHLNNIYKLGLKLILIDLRKICKKEKVETSILKEEIEKP
jgi:hypothetical protein